MNNHILCVIREYISYNNYYQLLSGIVIKNEFEKLS